MGAHVFRQLTGRGERLLAVAALKWLLTRVRPHMNGQVAGHRERALAITALERAFTGVGSDVHG